MRFAVRALASVAVIFIVAGCGQSGPTIAATQATAPTPESTFPAPKWDPNVTLGLIGDDGKLVKVGDTATDFNQHFPRQAALARSLTVSDLPMNVPQDTHWNVVGYQYENASRGAGALLYDNRVAVAMHQLENVQAQDVSNEVSKYTDQTSIYPTTVFGTRMSYYFWETPPVRLMISTFKTSQGNFNLTTAIADMGVGDKLGISLDAANANKDALNRIFGTSNDSTSPQ